MSLSKKLSLILVFVLFLLDQLSKLWARDVLKPLSRLDFIPAVLEFKYAENTGVAFSFFAAHPLILTIIISGINIGLLLFFFKLKKIPLYLIFILAGALSNLLDRYIFGFVTDMINPVFISFAVFNLADVFLNIGLYIYVIEQLLSLFNKKDN